MNDTTIIGTFGTTEDAERAINDLRGIGVKDADISYIYSAEGKIVTEDASGKAVGAGAASGASTGALVGGLAGLAVANGILPGLGTLFVGGPLAAALGLTGAAATTATGAITGAAAGGLIGALVGLGVGEEEAKIYEEKVKLGAVLLATETDNPIEVRQIFTKNNAEEIRGF